jgi:hypothetical protein
VDQLPRQPGREGGFAFCHQLGEMLGLAGQAPLGRRRVPAPDPARPGPGAGQHVAGLDMVCELYSPAGRGDVHVSEQGVDAPRIGSPMASRRGVFIRRSCGMNRSTSTSRPARAHQAPSRAGTSAQHGTPAASSQRRTCWMAARRAWLTDGRCTLATS